jgi:hypothetical protein
MSSAPAQAGDPQRLAYVDERETTVEAPADRVWSSLLEIVERVGSGALERILVRLLGCVDRASSGEHPLQVGSTLPGFSVLAAVPSSRLTLVGRHRFSRYALIFRLEPLSSTGSRLRAETRADFPGPHGRAYRLLVLGSRGHVLAVRRLLATVKRRAERHAGSRLG